MNERTLGWAAAVVVLIFLLGGMAWLIVEFTGEASQTQPLAPASGSTASADPARPAVRFPDGTIARLEGLRYLYDESPRWWGADGSEVFPDEFDFGYLQSLGGFEHGPRRAIEFRVSALGDRIRSKSYSLRISARKGGASHYQWDGPDGLIYSAVFSIDASVQETELEFAIADGPWEDADVVLITDAAARTTEAADYRRPARRTGVQTTQPAGPNPYRIFSISEIDGQTHVEYTDLHSWPEIAEMTWQAVVRDKSGRDHHRSGLRYPEGRMTYIYDLPMDRLQAAVYQVRPWQWRSLGTVRLQPATPPPQPPPVDAANP